MTIIGTNPGGYLPPMNPSTPPDTDNSTGGIDRRELDATQLLGKQKCGDSRFDAGNRQNTDDMPDPGGIDKDHNTQIIAHLGSLSEDQVTTDIYSFMALFQKTAQGMRDTARMQRSTQLQTQVSALQSAADQMQTAAGERYKAGIAQGIMQVVGGVAQAGFSAASLAATVNGASLENQGNSKLADAAMSKDAGKPAADVHRLTTDGNNLIEQGKTSTAYGAFHQGMGGAVTGISGGIGGCITAHFNREADSADTQRARLDAQAKVAETGQQQANDAMQQMMEVIRDVREKLQSIQQAAIETNRGIARNI